VITALAEFLGPVLDAAANGSEFEFAWPPGGPWQPGGTQKRKGKKS